MSGERRRKTSDELVLEIAERTRRVETRLTSYLEMQGFELNVRKPVFYPDTLELTLPTPRTSLKDILAVIPEGVTAAIGVYLGQDCIAVVSRPTTMPKSRA